MKAFIVLAAPLKAGAFNNPKGFDSEVYANKKEAFKRASKLKNGQDETMTVVLNSAGDILGGYMPDKWQGSEFILGYKFTDTNIPREAEKLAELFHS